MEEIKRVEEWKNEMNVVLESKRNELQTLGYPNATQEDIWKCLVKKVWKGNPEKRMYEVVQDIFHLGTGVYLSYLTTESHQDDDLMGSIAALTGNSDNE